MNDLIQEKRQKLAEVLQSARVQKGYSQEQLGEMVGVKYSTIRRIENSKFYPKLEIIYRLVDDLGISLNINGVDL